MIPLVTISIPLYNCENFIEKCLTSVLAQTYAALEVTLINDQTQDRSVQIAEDFIFKNDLENWRTIHLERNSGLSVVRNTGIETAKGKYIFFLDSDDQLLPHAIESLVRAAEKENTEMAVGAVQGINHPDNSTTDVFPLKVTEDVLSDNLRILKSFVEGEFPVSSWNKLLLLEFLKTNNLWFTPGLYAQDSLHSFEMTLRMKKAVFIREITYLYVLHANSVIHNRSEVHFKNWITIANKIDEHVRNEKDRLRRQLMLRYLNNYKTVTLEMNWRAQKNETLWKNSYSAYRKLCGFSFSDYFSRSYSFKEKKESLFTSLPVAIGFQLFKWRWGR